MSRARADQLLEAGLWLRKAGDEAGARGLFQKALLEDPHHPLAQRLMDGALGDLEAKQRPAEPPLVADGEAEDSITGWDQKKQKGLLVDAEAEHHDSVIDLVSSSEDLRLVRAPATKNKRVLDLLSAAADRQALDDHTGALELLEEAAVEEPLNAEVASRTAASRSILLSMAESKLGRLDRRPRVLLKQDEALWLSLDHRSGFVLAQIDGQVKMEDLFELCGMSRLDTARILVQLVERKVIGF